MKIDCIYIACNKSDFYFAKICMASIRYWNKNIPVFIIKDVSKGNFNTKELERFLDVKIADTPFNKLGYYSKLFPFYNSAQNKRVLILDADTVWLCDMATLMEQYEEDFIIDGYSPENVKEEMSKWYFTEPGFTQHYPYYQYPGFLFNVGQMLCNTNVITAKDLDPFVLWKENPEPVIKNVFFYEQGILNYIIAQKILHNQVSCRQVNFHLWGWDKRVDEINIVDIQNKKGLPFLIHWYGNKKGLTSFLPGAKILSFYESYYFSMSKGKTLYQYACNLKRTIINFPAFVYESGKAFYYLFKRKEN